jgi:hypothetical protein
MVKQENRVQSLNNRLLLEVYVPRALTTETKNGFASMSQTIRLVGLKVLVDFYLPDGRKIPKGSAAFLKEKTLMTHAQLKEVFEADEIGQKFIVAPLELIEFVKEA